MARSGGIDKSAIRKMMRGLQKEFDRNGPITVPVEGDARGNLVGAPAGMDLALRNATEGGGSSMTFDARIIRLMDWLFDQGIGEFSNLEEFVAGEEDPRGQAHLLGKHLDDHGWADVIFTFGGTSAKLNGRGISRIEGVRQARADRPRRAADLQRQMLRWLYEQEDQRTPPESWSAFLATEPSHLLGTAFSAEEVARHAEYLQSRNLLTSVTVEETGPGWLYPRLTPDGQDCVTSFDGRVADYMNRPSTSSGPTVYGPYIQGNANGALLAWGNQSVTQNQSATQQIAPGFESLASAVADVLRRLPEFGLADEDAEDAEVLGNEILAEVVTDSPDRGKLRRAFAALKGFLLPIAAQAGSGAAEGAHEAAKQAVEQLGSVAF
jgi:hypothetical protein